MTRPLTDDTGSAEIPEEAEIGFMDPPVAANVLYEPQIRQLPEAERAAFLAAKAAELGVVFELYGVAANLIIDDIVEPGATRGVVARYFRMSLATRPPRTAPGPLASWPRCFFTGLSDCVVQPKGACMALTGPRVLAIGTSEQVTMEELGGTDVHRHNGQADTIAETLHEVYAAIRRFVSFLPSAAGAPLPVSDHVPADDGSKIRFGTGQAHAARPLIDGRCDSGSFFELRQDFAPSLVTGLARLGGTPAPTSARRS